MKYEDCESCGSSYVTCLAAGESQGLSCCSEERCSHEPVEPKVKGRRFLLNRKQDVSGVSGTGVVAEGWVSQFGDAFIVWQGKTNVHSTGIYDSIEDLLEIHGHGDATEIIWID